MSSEWLVQENLFMDKVKKYIFESTGKFELYNDMTNYLVRNKFVKSKQELVEIFANKDKLKLFLLKLNFQFLSILAEREKKLQYYNIHIGPDIDGKKIKKYVDEKKLQLSYSIRTNKCTIGYKDDHIQAMHSVGKVITGFLIHLFARLKIIPITAFNEPLKIDTISFNKLHPKIQSRLKSTTMLNVMEHKSGLGDYLENYIKDVDNAVNKKLALPNPIEPEDFLCYSDNKLYGKGEEHYSNFGILLCGLCIKYFYNLYIVSAGKLEVLSYNQILTKFIVVPNKLKSFMISYKQIKNIKTNRDDKNNTKYLNASPSSGYWITAKELTILGYAIYKVYSSDKKMMSLLKQFGNEFYNKKDNIISHYGTLAYSTAYLEIDLDNGNIISIMSNNYNDTDILLYALHLFK
jgi:hypothetical protein